MLGLHETDTKSVRVSLGFIKDLADPFQIGSPIWYQMCSFVKVIWCEIVPFQGSTETM